MKHFFLLPLLLCSVMLANCTVPTGPTEKVLFKRGLARMEQRNFSLAEIDFSMTIQLNPENEVAYYNRGFCRLRLGLYADAIEDFSKAIEFDNHNYEAFYNRGNALRFIADDVKAAENLEAARRVYSQALEDMSYAISHNRKDPRYWRGRARVKMGLDDFRGAIRDLDVSVRLSNGRQPAYLYDRAEAYLALREFYDTIDNINQIISILPRDPQGYMFRAAVKVQAGDLEGACLDWSRAGELGELAAYEFIRENCGRW